MWGSAPLSALREGRVCASSQAARRTEVRGRRGGRDEAGRATALRDLGGVGEEGGWRWGSVNEKRRRGEAMRVRNGLVAPPPLARPCLRCPDQSQQSTGTTTQTACAEEEGLGQRVWPTVPGPSVASDSQPRDQAGFPRLADPPGPVSGSHGLTGTARDPERAAALRHARSWPVNLPTPKSGIPFHEKESSPSVLPSGS